MSPRPSPKPCPVLVDERSSRALQSPADFRARVRDFATPGPVELRTIRARARSIADAAWARAGRTRTRARRIYVRFIDGAQAVGHSVTVANAAAYTPPYVPPPSGSTGTPSKDV